MYTNWFFPLSRTLQRQILLMWQRGVIKKCDVSRSGLTWQLNLQWRCGVSPLPPQPSMSSSSSPPPPPVSFTFPHSSFFSFLVRSPLMESLFDMINVHDLLSAFKTSWTQPSLYQHPICTSWSSASSRNPSKSAHGSSPTSSHIAKTSLTSFLSATMLFCRRARYPTILTPSSII